MSKLMFRGNEIADVTYTSGGGGGGGLQDVLTDGIVSTTSNYATAYFDEAPTEDYLTITFKCTGVEQDNGITFKVSSLSSTETTFSLELNTMGTGNVVVFCAITDDYIRTTSYSGNFVEITATIKGYSLT